MLAQSVGKRNRDFDNTIPAPPTPRLGPQFPNNEKTVALGRLITISFGRSLQCLDRNCDAAVFPPGSTMTRVPTRTWL